MDSQETFKNPLKEKLKQGKKTAGSWLHMGSPIASEIVGRAGFDWVIIDMEHGPADVMTLVSQLQVMSGGNTVPIVRVPWNDFVIIKRVLDAGAFGLIIPYVNTKEEAVAAVQACKYPPEGIRGLAGSTRAAWHNQRAKNYFSTVNDEILIMTQVETRTAVDNLDEMLEVPGIDGIFIGPMDLATSMGHLADPSPPEVQDTIREVEEKVKKSGKFLATISANWDQAKALYDRGYQLISLMADGVGLAALSAGKVAEFRKEFPEG